jgi:hypothetical protein
MRTVVPTNKLDLLSHECIDAMGVAFDASWQSLVASGSALASPELADQTREALALRIIDIAQGRACDPTSMQEEALSYLLGNSDSLASPCLTVAQSAD